MQARLDHRAEPAPAPSQQYYAAHPPPPPPSFTPPLHPPSSAPRSAGHPRPVASRQETAAPWDDDRDHGLDDSGAGMQLTLSPLAASSAEQHAHPPWLSMAPEELHHLLQHWRLQQDYLHQQYYTQHYPAQPQAHAAPSPPPAPARSLPFLGTDFTLPPAVPALPKAHFLDPGTERMRQLALTLRRHGGRQAAASDAAHTAARATAAATAAAGGVEAEVSLQAETAAEKAFRVVDAAARKLRQRQTFPSDDGGGARQRSGSSGARRRGAARAESLGGLPAHELSRRVLMRSRGRGLMLAPQGEDKGASEEEAGVAEAVAKGTGAGSEKRLLVDPEAAPSRWLLPLLSALFPDPGMEGDVRRLASQVDSRCLHSGDLHPNCIPTFLRKGATWEGLTPERAADVAQLMLAAGASRRDLLRCLLQNNWLLGVEVRGLAGPNVRALQACGFSALPPSGSARRGIEGDMGGGGRRGSSCSSQLGRLLTRSPLLLVVPRKQQLEPMLHYLAVRLGVPLEGVERILKQDRSLLGEGGLQRMRTAVAFLYGKLLTREEVAHVAGRAPKVLGFSPLSLGLKWFYLEEALGGNQADVIKCPTFLTASLASVGARITLAESLGVRVLLPSQVQGMFRKLSMSRAAAALRGEERMDGVSLQLVVHDTDAEFCRRLGVPEDRLRQCWQQFHGGDWKEVLRSGGRQ